MRRVGALTRRRFLQGGGAGGLGALAGCARIGGMDRRTPDEFDYPAGFSPDGVDLDVALGSESAMMDVAGLSLEEDRRLAFPAGTLSVSHEAAFDRSSDRYVVDRHEHDTFQRQLAIREAYFDTEELFERRKVEPRSLEFDYRARRHSLDRREAYRLDDVRDVLADVDLTVSSVSGEGDHDVAVYTATTDDVGVDSIFRRVRDLVGELREADVALRVDDRGYLRSVQTDGAFRARDGGDVAMDLSWSYGAFGAVDVEEPDWLAGLPQRERPEVEVEFEEVPDVGDGSADDGGGSGDDGGGSGDDGGGPGDDGGGSTDDGGKSTDEGVVVHVRSMRNTDRVAVTLRGEGVFVELERPRSVTVPVEVYMTEDGASLRIFVFAEDRLRGPIQVAFYDPEPRRSSSA